MKTMATVCTALILLVTFACKQTPSEPDEADFAIYLLDDDTITATAAATKPLAELALVDEPLISGADITAYVWAEHQFTLMAESTNKLEAYEFLPGKTFGIPLVVMAGGERIYMGAIWYMYSSLMPAFPYITVMAPSDQTGTLSLSIRLGEYVETDPRNDPRIQQVLQAAGILVE